MSLEQSTDISHPVVKVVAVGTAAATSFTLQDISYIVSIVAGLFGILYSIHLLAEWWWKKYFRALFIRRGWIQPYAYTPKDDG